MRTEIQRTSFFLSLMIELWTKILHIQMGRDARKPVIGGSDKVRLKPACSATETS